MSKPHSARRGVAVPSPRSTCAASWLRQDMGVYVLGALAGSEARPFEAHLASCPSCSTELKDLLSVRMLLDSVDHAIVAPGGVGAD